MMVDLGQNNLVDLTVAFCTELMLKMMFCRKKIFVTAICADLSIVS